MLIEICADSVEMSVAAAKAGADRIELCAAISEGGITPSLGLIRQVCRSVNIPVHVMIRPRAGDFLYSNEEFRIMRDDIQAAGREGAAGVVFGILMADGSLDEKRCGILLQDSGKMIKVFHRAFDMTNNCFDSIKKICDLEFDILLTSGQRQTAIEGVDLIRQLVKQSDKVQIMAGSGVNGNNAATLASTGIQAIHFTSRKSVPSAMKYQNRELLSMGSGDGKEYDAFIFDDYKFQSIRHAISSFR